MEGSAAGVARGRHRLFSILYPQFSRQPAGAVSCRRDASAETLHARGGGVGGAVRRGAFREGPISASLLTTTACSVAFRQTTAARQRLVIRRVRRRITITPPCDDCAGSSLPCSRCC